MGRAMETMCAHARTAADFIIGGSGDAVDYIIYRAGQFLRILMSLKVSVRDISKMFPLTMAMAPGILEGAIRVKQMVPQSSIPGMMIMLLPWLVVPFMWTLGSILIQLIANFWFIVGLILNIAAPLVYVVVGRMYRVDRAMTDADISLVNDEIEKYRSYVGRASSIFMYLFFIPWIWTMCATYGISIQWLGIDIRPWADGTEGIQDWLIWERDLIVALFGFDGVISFLTSKTFFRIICTIPLVVLSRYFLTIIAVMDVLVSNMVNSYVEEQRMYLALQRRK